MPPLRRLVNWLLGFPDWLYGRRAAGLDLGPALLAGGWTWLMLAKPDLFDRGSFVGMDWLPDAAWIWLMATMSVLHTAGLMLPTWRALRVGASLLSAWAWIFVSLSLTRVEVTTGFLAYMLAGCGCLCAALFVAGLPRDPPRERP